MQTGI